jgi:hypothetical protein
MTKMSQRKEGSKLFISIEGNINEDSDLDKLPLEGITELIIDLNELEYIKSIGIKNWIQWVKTFPKKTKLVLKNCTPHIVNQFNMINGLLPQGTVVESFYVPFFCNACGREDKSLMLNGKDFEGPVGGKPARINIPKEMTCPECKGNMEIDTVESKYFQFLGFKG